MHQRTKKSGEKLCLGQTKHTAQTTLLVKGWKSGVLSRGNKVLGLNSLAGAFLSRVCMFSLLVLSGCSGFFHSPKTCTLVLLVVLNWP